MSIVSTYEWKSTENVYEKLSPYFPDVKVNEMTECLLGYGMCKPSNEFYKVLEELHKRHIWVKLKKRYLVLKREWKGPDIPIFILPSNIFNRKIQTEFNGRSGVAFEDKLFVFMSMQTSDEEAYAVLTHEYNHVCRMKSLNKKENDLTLLDTMIMEGLAEYAVKEYCGETYMAPWTDYYSKQQAEQFWNKYLINNQSLKHMSKRHDELLFGQKWYPKMLGYGVGYHIVMSCVEKHLFSSKQLMATSSNTILQKSTFNLNND
ncbi:DUF2268 domain-containing protein [Metabacillus iocasae]|uniref:Uncharacterized protein YjaZ n=1 Tax=Priestia iocasae TaxID=2291674 RepID=A0ABS2QUA8_9BACI|nr:DUF2268 domain-containing protein [Metabacillus iocasae]MBM7702577.1 uncharacterized protein YjaZ [Metabacillus iocasae]